MDYEFSDIPLEQQGRSLRLNSSLGLRTAYGQLIALVFVPICVLAVVGASIVLSETSKSAKAQQKAEAQAMLTRYEPVVKKLVPILHDTAGKKQAQEILQSMQVEAHLNRAAVVDATGHVLLSVGRTDLSWPKFNKKAHFLYDLQSSLGDVYGTRAGMFQDKQLWLLVDVENEQLTIARYKVWLAIAVTGLFTILMLLLCINVYSKRWIAPIYEMRLHLQQTNHTNLYKPMYVVSSGEMNLLQRDIVFMLRRLHVSYQELKEYAEQTEDDLRSAFDEMEIQNISIRSARDAAVMANETKSAFLANISHELRTPLNSIDGFINLLARKHDLSPEQNMYVQTIRKSSAHLLALVNDVLDFSKIEAGKLILEQQEVDLYAVIYDVVDMLTPLAAEKNIALSVFYYDDVPAITIADELRCKQVLTNLVSNALKFTESGEVIVRVSLSEIDEGNDNQQESIIISVQDTGKGVATEARDNLFKRFSQADKSITRQFGGTGLGLVISKQLVQLMGGNIGYKDNASENIATLGSTFWFSLPTADSVTQPVLSILEQPLNVLAFLDHESSMRVLMGQLSSMGVQLTKAATTAGLIERFRAKKYQNSKARYDWIILDGNEDLATILSGIRENYHGKIAVFGYQTSLDLSVLETYKAHALYQPLNRRKLYQLLAENDVQEPDEIHTWQGVQVLAVDDHMPNLMVLDALLSELEVNVTTVNSGADAIDTFNRKNLSGKPFDLIFMDIQMPHMSGFETTQQIRALEAKNQHTPIVALTAHALADEKEKLLASGMDDYASKPISHTQLLELLTKWLGSQKLAASTQKKDDTITSTAIQEDVFDERNKVVINTVHTTEDLPIIDWQDALVRSANKADLAKDVLNMLLASLPAEKDELQAAWEMADMPELGQVVHRIVGGTRYTGVPMLRHMAQTLDQQIIAQADTPVEIAKKMFTESYINLLTAIDKLIDVDLSQWNEPLDSVEEKM